MTSISTYISSKELFANLTLRELRAKYKRSFLGWTWSLANPLANMIVYTIVFKYFLKQQPQSGRPERPQRICAVPAVRSSALELLPDLRDGQLGQPHG